jgi:LysR family transcriptional regulator of beta-lactamase
MTAVCAPAIAALLKSPRDLVRERLLRSYRADEWALWFDAAGVPAPILRGPIFDSSALMASAAAAGLGVALVPFAMFNRELASELLVQPFAVEIDVGRYWLTRLNSRPETAAMRQFRDWLMDEIDSAFFQALP